MRRFLFRSCLLATVVTGLALLSPYSVDDVRDLGPEAIRTAARLARQPHVTPTTEVDCDFCPQRIASCAAELPHCVHYVPDYVRIDFPMGDVPETTGVWADAAPHSYTLHHIYRLK